MKFVLDSVVSASALKNVVTAMPATVTHQARGHIHRYNLSFISSPCLALKVSPTWGCQAGTFNYTARGELPDLGPGSVLLHPTRPPPPVILPAAPCASLGLGGAFAPGFALRARTTVHVLRAGTCCSHCALGAITPTSPGRLMSAGGSASPQGEARREAPPRRSAATAAAGRITGGGGRAV